MMGMVAMTSTQSESTYFTFSEYIILQSLKADIPEKSTTKKTHDTVDWTPCIRHKVHSREQALSCEILRVTLWHIEGLQLYAKL